MTEEVNEGAREPKTSEFATKARACGNCTCGRVETEVKDGEAAAAKALLEAGIRASCGSSHSYLHWQCYLGDAYRSDGCPYKGLPAFKPGERTVGLDDLEDCPDVQSWMLSEGADEGWRDG
eukprot:GHVU01097759.1.p2 GENE.GHVU01097759.1~~GHVU01097759.1.p2  ORF type:complete len:121 (-),score=22.97 GHVU01097759.1:20-382(-)